MTYSCKVFDGPTQVNLCDFYQNSETFFNEDVRTYYFWTENKAEIPPGMYKLGFTGTVGDMSATVYLWIQIEDSC